MSKNSAKQNIEQTLAWLKWRKQTTGQTQNKHKFSKAKAYKNAR